MMSTPHSDSMVEEIQGLYGPFTFSEMLFQKIWAEGAFDQTQLTTTDGQSVQIRNVGRWNKLAGPDFMQARIRFDEGRELIGDVELHLRAEDWVAHGHAQDSAYSDVKLHVVLFPPRADVMTRDGEGGAIPTLVLLPWLHHDLQEYAAEAAVEVMANHPETWILEKLCEMPRDELRAHLDGFAKKRWEQKVHFAGLRIAKVGWQEACHQTAMEILGFRYNRVPMLQAAMRYDLASWSEADFQVEAVFDESESKWRASGVRPANHPHRRLAQYRDWVQARPDWPDLLEKLGAELLSPDFGVNTSEVRREHELSARRKRLSSAICGDALGGTRLDTMICDGFWPLLASGEGLDLAGLWYHWYAGDAPARLSIVLRQTGRFEIGRDPACHGGVQGLLGFLVETDPQTV